jgi:hypothetical protein
MHKAIAAALLAGLFLCAGCFTAAPPLLAPPAPKAVDMAKTSAAPPVRPEDVKEDNYCTIPQRLSEELDREEQENLSGRQFE